MDVPCVAGVLTCSGEGHFSRLDLEVLLDYMDTSSANHFGLQGASIEKAKLTGPNFIDWYRQLRIVLSIEDKLNYLEQPLPPAPVAPAGSIEGQHVAPEILQAHTRLGVKNSVYPSKQSRELLQTLREIFILQTRTRMAEFDGFVQNYNMHSLGKTVNELHAMLKLHEQTLPKNNAPALHAILRLVKSPRKGLGQVRKLKSGAALLDNAGYILYITVSNYALLWHCRLGPSARNALKKLQHDWTSQFNCLRASEKCVPCMSENSLTNQEASGSLEDLEIIQEEDTYLSIDTSLNHKEDDIEIDEPQSDIIPIRRLVDQNCLFSMDISMKRFTWSKHEIFMGIALPMLQMLNPTLESVFAMKDFSDFNGELLTWKYHQAQIKHFLSNSQGASTPAKFLKRMLNVPYASAVGFYMYANILKYLRNTKDMFLAYGGDIKRELKVSCYTDDGINDQDHQTLSASCQLPRTVDVNAEDDLVNSWRRDINMMMVGDPSVMNIASLARFF
ncbi:hypothetical protein Tco_1503957 [Tanacetum coccineum]